MSTDDGIYIAKFLDGFRVTYSQAIRNIDYYPEGSKERKEELKRYFKYSPIFETVGRAERFARFLKHKETTAYCKNPEYGISYIGEYESWE